MSRRSLMCIAAVVIVVLVGVGLAGTRHRKGTAAAGRPSTSNPPPSSRSRSVADEASTSSTTTTLGPIRDVDSGGERLGGEPITPRIAATAVAVAAGSSPSPIGVARFAQTYVRLEGSLTQDSLDQAAAVQAVLSTPAADHGLAAKVRDQLANLRLEYPNGSLRVVTVPVAVRVDFAGRVTAEVAVWRAAVAWSPSTPMVTSWDTETLELVWQAGRWLVDRDVSAPGPNPVAATPDATPPSGAQLAASLAGFEEVR